MEKTMLAVRLDPKLEQRLARYCERRGLTKTAVVARSLEREIAGGLTPYAALIELTRDLPGSGNAGNSRNVSQRLKRRLRAKHRR
jgi:predicted DNA-binding protein